MLGRAPASRRSGSSGPCSTRRRARSWTCSSTPGTSPPPPTSPPTSTPSSSTPARRCSSPTCPNAAGPPASSAPPSTSPTTPAPRIGSSPPWVDAVTDPDPVEATLQAISHRGRRAMLRLAWDAERTSSELADAAGLSRSAASQHLKVLRDAGLVQVRVDANRRLYRVDPATARHPPGVPRRLLGRPPRRPEAHRRGHPPPPTSARSGTAREARRANHRDRRPAARWSTSSSPTPSTSSDGWPPPPRSTPGSAAPSAGPTPTATPASGSSSSSFPPAASSSPTAGNDPTSRSRPGRPPSRSPSNRTPRGTRLRLVHRGLAGPMADAHAGGWANYLARLAVAADGADPGPDPLAGERVPPAADLRLR